MTEVPEYLLERSRQRRIDLGLLEDDGSGGGGASGAPAGEALASSGPSSADVIAAAKADAKLERVENGADTLLADVLEDPRNADAVDDGLGGTRRALLLGGRTRHFEVELWVTVYVERVCEFKYFLTQKSISIFCKINSFLALLF